jgi:putative PIN family toxin of toxin-antitoxin system
VGKKVKVVFDTNVWVSIFMKKVLSDEFSKVKQYITVYVSPEILLEISKVLLYPKIEQVLKKAGVNQKAVLRAIKANSAVVQPKIKLEVIDDAEDNRILECAVAAGAGIIVSGDKHLLELGKFKKSKILTPREFYAYFIAEVMKETETQTQTKQKGRDNSIFG